MLQLVAMFAFMLTPVWIILVGAAGGWLSDICAKKTTARPRPATCCSPSQPGLHG